MYHRIALFRKSHDEAYLLVLFVLSYYYSSLSLSYFPVLCHLAVEEQSQHLSSSVPDSHVGSRDMGPGFALFYCR